MAYNSESASFRQPHYFTYGLPEEGILSKNKSDILTELRKKIYLAGRAGGMAHLASCFSALEILYSLYCEGILRIDASNPSARDRFILSKGHGGLALYAVLEEAGYLPNGILKTYLQPQTRIGGEPYKRDWDVIETSTGSLGHGLSVAVGMALAQKMDHEGARTFVLIGDGESQEGSVWEAAMSAAAFHLDNLITILDCNGLQKTDHIEETMGGDPNWHNKWEAFGWNVSEVDGHDLKALNETLSHIRSFGKPHLIIAHTVKGKGVSIMENQPQWHFKLPNRKEEIIFRNELGIMDEGE